jgi:hypothetical protein
MFNIVKKDSNKTTTILDSADSFENAERLLMEHAKKNGGGFEDVKEGFFLLRSDKDIKEYRKYIKTKKTGWLWSSNSTSYSDVVFVASYEIVKNSEQDSNAENLNSKTENLNSNTEDQDSNTDNNSSERTPVVVIVNTIYSDGTMTTGFLDSIPIETQQFLSEQTRNKMRQLSLSNDLKSSTLLKLVTDIGNEKISNPLCLQDKPLEVMSKFNDQLNK